VIGMTAIIGASLCIGAAASFIAAFVMNYLPWLLVTAFCCAMLKGSP